MIENHYCRKNSSKIYIAATYKNKIELYRKYTTQCILNNIHSLSTFTDRCFQKNIHKN